MEDFQELRRQAEAKAMGPAADGQEPIPHWSFSGDGSFSVSFGGIGWGPHWSPDAAKRCAEALAHRWRRENSADTQGLPVICIHAGRTIPADQFSRPSPYWSVENGGKPVAVADSVRSAEQMARTELLRLLGFRNLSPEESGTEAEHPLGRAMGM